MRFGKPTTQPDIKRKQNDSKYAPIRQQVDRLKPGDWLPVIGETKEEALALEMAIRASIWRSRHGQPNSVWAPYEMRCDRKNNTIYLRRRLKGGKE